MSGGAIPWIEPIWERLGQARSAERLPHALLIHGPRGLGKRALVERLARGLLCAEPGADGSACGGCPQCRLTAAGSHPDLILIGPDAESRSGEIPVDAIRALGERISLSGGASDRRVAIIDPADRMSPGAANALLKTLEEPPPGAVLILIAELLGRLPATIRSRCQILRIPLPPREDALAWLVPKLGADAELRLSLARGAPLAALEAGEASGIDQRRERLSGLLGIVRGKHDVAAEARGWIGLGVASALGWQADWLCDLIRLQYAGDQARVDALDLRDILTELAGAVDPTRAHRLLQRVFEAQRLLDANLNEQLTIESLLIDWSRLARH